MKFKKITIAFEADNILLAEELICDIFFSFNLKGVVCNIPLKEPDEGFGTHTLALPSKNSIIGYLPDVDSSQVILEKIRNRAAQLAAFDIKVFIDVETVDEKEWADAWKKYFNVTHITDKIVIKPAWKDYAPGPNEILIHLDPGMAFGTGTHPTTAMCIKQIEQFLAPGSTFLDVGTGSGILMILAAKLSAGKMTGIDTDETAVSISRKNLGKNKVDSNRYELYTTTLDQTEKKTYDIIAANIIAQVIVNIMPDIKKRMKKTTLVILSGIIQERKKDVMAALLDNGLVVVHEDNIDEWVTMTVKADSKTFAP